MSTYCSVCSTIFLYMQYVQYKYEVFICISWSLFLSIFLPALYFNINFCISSYISVYISIYLSDLSAYLYISLSLLLYISPPLSPAMQQYTAASFE